MATKTQRKRKQAQRAHHQKQTRRPREAPADALVRVIRRYDETKRNFESPIKQAVSLIERSSPVPIGWLGTDEEWHAQQQSDRESKKRPHLPTRRGICPTCETRQKLTVRGHIAGHGDCAGKGEKPVANA